MDRDIGLDAHASSCTVAVVAAVRESRGPKCDKVDAFGLAKQLRIGAINPDPATCADSGLRRGL